MFYIRLLSCVFRDYRIRERFSCENGRCEKIIFIRKIFCIFRRWNECNDFNF